MTWYTKTFTEKEILDAKNAGREKQIELSRKYGAYNNLVSESRYRWAGDLGEIAFFEMMTEKYGRIDGIDIIRHTTKSDYDDCDFTISSSLSLKIDVKTVIGNVEPRPEYYCNVNAIQMEKIKRQDSPVNTLVFAQFCAPSRMVYIPGWMLKNEFVQRSRLIKSGAQSNKITINSDVWCLEYANLHPFKKALS